MVVVVDDEEARIGRREPLQIAPELHLLGGEERPAQDCLAQHREGAAGDAEQQQHERGGTPPAAAPPPRGEEATAEDGERQVRVEEQLEVVVRMRLEEVDVGDGKDGEAGRDELGPEAARRPALEQRRRQHQQRQQHAEVLQPEGERILPLLRHPAELPVRERPPRRARQLPPELRRRERDADSECDQPRHHRPSAMDVGAGLAPARPPPVPRRNTLGQPQPQDHPAEHKERMHVHQRQCAEQHARAE